MDKPNILIVSDVLNLRISVASILKNARYRVETTHVLDAQEFMRHNRFDLLFLDIRLPHQAGMKLLFSARIMYPAMQTVVISSIDDIDFQAKVMRNGAKSFLLKPVEPGKIIQTCDSLFAIM